MSEFYKNRKRLEIKVGILFLIGLLILIIGYAWFQKYLENFKYTELKVLFKNADNIEKGSNVSILGVKKGYVKNIQIDQNGVLLSLMAELDFPLAKDTKFNIREINLIGDRQVDIIPGKSQMKLDYSKTANGTVQYGITHLVVQMNQMLKKIEEFGDNFKNQNEIFSDFQKITLNLSNILDKTNSFLDSNSEEIPKIVQNINSITENMDDILINNKELINNTLKNSDKISSDLNTSILNFNNLIKQITLLSSKANQKNNSFNKLISDEELYNNLLKITNQMDSLLIDIKKNPKKYFKIEVF